MAKVVSVEARTVHIPLRVATAFARRKVTSRDYSLVKIRTDDGIEGIGHCYAGHSGGNVVTTAVREMLNRKDIPRAVSSATPKRAPVVALDQDDIAPTCLKRREFSEPARLAKPVCVASCS